MLVGRKIALMYTSRDLVGKFINNITKPKQPEIYGTPLDRIKFNFTEVRNFIPDDRSNNVFREAIVTKCSMVNSTSSSNSEHIINARCVRVLIRLNLLLLWTK